MTCLVELLCWLENTVDHYNKAYSDDSYSAVKSCFNLTRMEATQSLIAASDQGLYSFDLDMPSSLPKPLKTGFEILCTPARLIL